jgi:hypothetical protein
VEGSGRGLIERPNREIPLEGLRKNTKTIIQDSWSLGQDLKPRPAANEVIVLTGDELF